VSDTSSKKKEDDESIINKVIRMIKTETLLQQKETKSRLLKRPKAPHSNVYLSNLVSCFCRGFLNFIETTSNKIINSDLSALKYLSKF